MYRPEDQVPVESVDSVRPVAVHLARAAGPASWRFALLVLDLDTRGGLWTRAQLLEWAGVFVAAARAEGITAAVAHSGQGGGVHVWMGCAEGVRPAVAARLAVAARRLCPAVDVAPLMNPATGAVRPPGAAHRDGGHSVLVGCSVEDAVRDLGWASPPAAAFTRLAGRLESVADAVVGAGPGSAVSVGEGTAVFDPGALRAAERAVAGESGRPVVGGWRARVVRQVLAPDGGVLPRDVVARGPVLCPVTADAFGRVRLDVVPRDLGARAVASLMRRHAPSDDHSALCHGPAKVMALAGWSYAQARERAFDPELSPALEWVRTSRAGASRVANDAAERERRFARVWWLAVQDAARMPPRGPRVPGRVDAVEEAVRDLLARMRSVDVEVWSRPGGPADQQVLRAVAFLMVDSGVLEVTADCRRVGVLAGYTAQTANEALKRLMRDGWLVEVDPADLSAGEARRVRLATAHVCTGTKGHRCAPYTAASHFRAVSDAVVAGHYGSDRRRNAAPPYRAHTPRTLPEYLGTLSTQAQAGLWHDTGHHLARTLDVVEEGAQPVIYDDLKARAGYADSTLGRHLRLLQNLGQVRLGRTSRGALTVVRARTRTLYEAARSLGKGSEDRPARLAVKARVEQARARWWTGEVTWSRLSRETKRGQRRAHPSQTVLPGMDATGRAYPRTPSGVPDHQRARAIEADRINAPTLLAHATRLAQAGDLVDPPRILDNPVPNRLRAADTRTWAKAPGGRAWLSDACPQCHAPTGERCLTWHGTGARNPHAARLHAALDQHTAATRA